MLIQHIVVEAGITDGKTSEFSSVPVWISTALDGSSDQPKLQQFLIEEASMSA